jgi:hypothetical protein
MHMFCVTILLNLHKLDMVFNMELIHVFVKIVATHIWKWIAL